jgi:hypothetical protein
MTLEEFNFISTFNMGYEGFSRPLPLDRMHPIYGQRSELLFLLGLFLLVPLVKNARKKNEDALREIASTNNRYAELPLAPTLRQPSRWTD